MIGSASFWLARHESGAWHRSLSAHVRVLGIRHPTYVRQSRSNASTRDLWGTTGRARKSRIANLRSAWSSSPADSTGPGDGIIGDERSFSTDFGWAVFASRSRLSRKDGFGGYHRAVGVEEVGHKIRACCPRRLYSPGRVRILNIQQLYRQIVGQLSNYRERIK